MKLFRFVFLAVLLFASALVSAQNDNGLGFFTKEQIEERDAIINNSPRYNTNVWDLYDNMGPQVDYDYVNRKIQEAQRQNKPSGGVTISNDNSTVRTGSSQNKSAARQRQQMQKAQNEARHKAWLEQKRAERERAAQEQRMREKLRRQRELEEQQRKYDHARDRYLAATAAHSAATQSAIYYRSHEGYYNMLNYNPPEMEKMKSEYIPEPEEQNAPDIDYIVSSRSSGRPAIIGLTGNEVPTTGDSDYDKAIEKMWLEDEARRKELPKVDFSIDEQSIWADLYTIWDDGQKAYIEYMMKEINNDVREVAHEKEDGSIYMTTKKVLPNALGINDKGQYVFESADGKKIFWVSPDGTTLQAITLEEHFWEDDNIIKKLKNGEIKFNDVIKGENKGGYANLMEIKNGKWVLKDIDEKEMKKLLPQIKGSIKMSLIDNSTTGEWHGYYIPRQQAWLPKGIAQPTFGSSLAVSGGLKAEASVEGSIDENGIAVKAKAGFSIIEGRGNVIVGSVFERDGLHFLYKGDAGMKIGVGGETPSGKKEKKEIELNIPTSGYLIYGGVKIGGAFFECLDCN